MELPELVDLDKSWQSGTMRQALTALERKTDQLINGRTDNPDVKGEGILAENGTIGSHCLKCGKGLEWGRAYSFRLTSKAGQFCSEKCALEYYQPKPQQSCAKCETNTGTFPCPDEHCDQTYKNFKPQPKPCETCGHKGDDRNCKIYPEHDCICFSHWTPKEAPALDL